MGQKFHARKNEEINLPLFIQLHSIVKSIDKKETMKLLHQLDPSW